MSNITMIKADTRHYFQFCYNKEKIQEKRDFKSELVYNLSSQADILIDGYEKIIDFLNKSNLSRYSEVKEAILRELESNRKIMKDNENPIIKEMLKELDNKSITESSYSLLNEVIEYQTKILQNILEREISEERLDVCINYLSEHLYYLKYDLELKELPTLTTSNKIEGIKLNKRITPTVTVNYDARFQEVYMKKGA